VILDARPLTDLASAVGIDAADLRLGDSKKVFQRSPAADTRKLAVLPWDVLRTVLDAYGDAVQLTLDYADVPVCIIDSSMNAADWDQIRSGLEPTGQYRMRIGVDKARLLDLNGLDGRNISHFFFATRLLAVLDEGPCHIGMELWDDADAPALILVGDANVDLAGPLLHVAGGVYLNNAVVPHAGIPADVLTALRETRRENVSVDAAVIGDLTPWHLEAHSRGNLCSGTGERVRARLTAVHAQLCLLSICDRARSCEILTAARIEFRSTERVASLTADSTSSWLQGITDPQSDALTSVVSWCYEDVLYPAPRTWTTQRIQFVQVRIAMLAGAAPEADQHASFLRAITDIDATKDVFWKTFLGDAISDYLTQLRELDDMIDTTANAYSEQASGITGKLTGSVLAAVGAFIGSIVAAAFTKPFNADLFRAGIWTYAGYLLIFPAGLGLSVQYSQYCDMRTQFARRRSDYDALLGEDHVSTRIGSRITDAARRWWIFFSATLALYAVIVAAAVVGGAEIPGLVNAPVPVTADHTRQAHGPRTPETSKTPSPPQQSRRRNPL
jgi:hypothetical protein